MTKTIFRLSAAALAIAATTAPATAQTLAEDAKAFGTREYVLSADLAPDGSKLMLLTGEADTRIVAKSFPMDGSDPTVFLFSEGTEDTIDWCRFSDAEMLVCASSGSEEWQDTRLGWSRLLAVSADGKSAPQPLGDRTRSTQRGFRQSDGQVLDFLPGENSILMARQYVADRKRTGSRLGVSKEGLAIERINLSNMKSDPIENADEEAAFFLSDGEGHVRIRRVDEMRYDNLTGRSTYFYRKKGEKKWEPLTTTTNEDGFFPIAIVDREDAVYGLQRTGGRDALYKMALDGSGTTTLVARHERNDIDGVVRLGRGLPIIGYSYADTASRVKYFEPAMLNLQDQLQKALPDTPLVSFHAASADGSKLLLSAESDRDAGHLYLLDRDTLQMEKITPVRPLLVDRQLAEQKPVSLKARDGAAIPSYLTLPPGKEATNLPLVVLPHGGPAARDVWGFDWLAQFLAARGYAVVQPNFRGSSGYGEEWQNENGFRNWRQAVADIEDSARSLIADGAVDADRVAIAGWSYGGYAALLGAAESPDLYKATIAIAPVTSLDALIDEAQYFTNEQMVKTMIGSGDHLRTGSPVRRAADIQAPVLLVHGDRDTTVLVDHSLEMRDKLSGAGKQVKLLRYEDLDHGLEGSDARTEMLTEIGALLDRTIGS